MSSSDITALKHAKTVFSLRSMRTGESFAVTGEILIGREPDCDIRLNMPLISRHHAKITPNTDTLILEDLNSSNGTFLNGERITSAVAVRTGDKVSFDSVSFRITSPNAAKTIKKTVSSPPLGPDQTSSEIIDVKSDDENSFRTGHHESIGKKAGIEEVDLQKNSDEELGEELLVDDNIPSSELDELSLLDQQMSSIDDDLNEQSNQPSEAEVSESQALKNDIDSLVSLVKQNLASELAEHEKLYSQKPPNAPQALSTEPSQDSAPADQPPAESNTKPAASIASDETPHAPSLKADDSELSHKGPPNKERADKKALETRLIEEKVTEKKTIEIKQVESRPTDTDSKPLATTNISIDDTSPAPIPSETAAPAPIHTSSEATSNTEASQAQVSTQKTNDNFGQTHHSVSQSTEQASVDQKQPGDKPTLDAKPHTTNHVKPDFVDPKTKVRVRLKEKTTLPPFKATPIDTAPNRRNAQQDNASNNPGANKTVDVSHTETSPLSPEEQPGLDTKPLESMHSAELKNLVQQVLEKQSKPNNLKNDLPSETQSEPEKSLTQKTPSATNFPPAEQNDSEELISTESDHERVANLKFDWQSAGEKVPDALKDNLAGNDMLGKLHHSISEQDASLDDSDIWVTHSSESNESRSQFLQSTRTLSPQIVMMSAPTRGKIFSLDDDNSEWTIGRAAESAIYISDTDMAHNHAKIQLTSEGYVIETCQITNGMLINSRFANRAVLNNGDLIKFGKIEIVFQEASEEEEKTTVSATELANNTKFNIGSYASALVILSALLYAVLTTGASG